MQKHTKIYMRFFDYGEQDIIRCECCGKTGRIDGDGFDLHHINGRVGKDANEIKNLILLCRTCHSRAHGIGKYPLSKGEVQ
jgi:5-methylcytosine-specific restriction endonuclease McrA